MCNIKKSYCREVWFFPTQTEVSLLDLKGVLKIGLCCKSFLHGDVKNIMGSCSEHFICKYVLGGVYILQSRTLIASIVFPLCHHPMGR